MYVREQSLRALLSEVFLCKKKKKKVVAKSVSKTARVTFAL